MGGFAAAWVGFSFSLPPVIHLLAAMAFAVFAGVAWIALPAFFRTRYNANEVVSTILANYVAVLITSYLTINIFKRPGGLPETPPILPTAYLPEFFSFSRLNWGLVIGIALAIGAQFVFHRTARGYAISEMGANPKFAEYGGIDIRRQGFLVLLASGAVGGLAGGIEALGVHRRFMEGFAPGFGFDGVIAALLANGSPIGTIAHRVVFRRASQRIAPSRGRHDSVAGNHHRHSGADHSGRFRADQVQARRVGQYGGRAAVEVLGRLFNVLLIVATLRTTAPILLVGAWGIVHHQGRHLQHRP